VFIKAVKMTRQNITTKGHWQGYRQFATGCMAQPVHVSVGGFNLFHNKLAVLKKYLAFTGHAHLSGVTLQQPNLQIVFQTLYEPAHARLRHAQGARCR
jgi:hypothetical protein